MRKRAYFDSYRGDRWPNLEDLEPYFLAPPAQRWRFRSRNDCWGLDAEGLDGTEPKVRDGSVRVLMALHENNVVDGLLQRVDKTGDPYQKQAVLKGLCRLYNIEKEWDGSIKTWWTTRPDTTGPYYAPGTWERSACRIKPVRPASTTWSRRRQLRIASSSPPG